MSTAAARPHAPPSLELVAGTDHKRVGVNLAATALAFFAAGGVYALLMRAELAQPGMQLVSRDSYDALMTMHGSTMVYLFVTPMAVALGLYLVPLQIGAREIAAPRLALAGFWLWLAGGLTMQSGWLTVYGPGKAGWFSYVPLSDQAATPGPGMDMWVLGVAMAAAGLLALSWCVLATVMRRRAPGMTLMRMPIFTWSMLASVLMVIGSFPVLLLAMTLLYLERLGIPIYTGYRGAIDYQDLFWFFGHPVVYVMFFPFLGAALEAVATCSRKRLFGYHAAVLSLLVFASLSMSVWAHHMFTTGGSANRYFALTSHALIVPAGVEYLGVVGTMAGGALVMRSSMLFGLGFFLQFLIGGLSGVLVASPPLDYHAQDSYIVVGHFHYTLMAGSVFGLFAGIFHWFPKVTGALLREGLGRLQFALMAVGVNLTFFPMFLLGERGMPRRVADYPASTGWGTLNLVETVGAFVIALGVLVFAVNLWVSLRRRVAAGDDPWGGHSLEWATTSPPPRHNFDRPLPPIRSYAPVLDARAAAAAGAPGPAAATEGAAP